MSAETISNTKVEDILGEDAILSQDETAVAGPDYEPREYYRGGKIVSIPEDAMLQAKFVYSWNDEGTIREIEGPEFDLAKLINAPSENAVYIPWRRKVPKARGMLMAGRTLPGQFIRPEEAWDLGWLRTQREKIGKQRMPITGIRPQTDKPETFQFMLYVKETKGGNRTLYLYDANSSNGNSATFPIARTENSNIASLAKKLELMKKTLTGEPVWKMYSEMFRKTFLRTQNPRRNVFSDQDLERALKEASDYAAANGVRYPTVYLAAFLMNYFIIGDRLDIGIHDEMEPGTFDPALFDRYSRYLKKESSLEGEVTIHTIVNESLMDPETEYKPRPKNEAGQRIDVPGFRIRHIPLMPLDDIDHHRRIGCGGFVEGTQNREYELQIILEYLPGMLK